MSETTQAPAIDMVTVLLEEARHEIVSLRRANQVLGAKMEVVELFGRIFEAQAPRRGYGESIDVAWKIEQELKRRAEQARLSAEPADV
jgi:hypothetical protein